MKVEKTKTLLHRTLLITLLAAACLLNAVLTFAADGAGTGYHYESEQWNLDDSGVKRHPLRYV